MKKPARERGIFILLVCNKVPQGLLSTFSHPLLMPGQESELNKPQFLRVIEPVASLLLPKVIIVSPFISEATSTFEEPPDVNDAGAPDPLRVITSFAGSKPVIMTLPSVDEETDPFELNVTSYK